MLTRCFYPSKTLINTSKYLASKFSHHSSGQEKSSSNAKYFGLLAGSLHEQFEMSFDDAYEVMIQLPNHDITSFVKTFEEEKGMKVVYGTKELVVLDSIANDTKDKFRSLHFTRRLDLEQSSVALMESGHIQHNAPPPGALHGLMFALALAQPLTLASGFKEARVSISDCLVLGGGGCSIPAFIHSLLGTEYWTTQPLRVEAVEVREDVVSIAREYFGIKELEEQGSFILTHADARDIIARVSREGRSIDILIVDLEDGSEEGDDGDGKIVAPPSWIFNHLIELTQVIRVGGVLAMNVICAPDRWPVMEKLLTSTFEGVRSAFDDEIGFTCGSIVAPHDIAPGGRQRIFFAIKHSDESYGIEISKEALTQRLLNLPPLVPSALREQWTAGWSASDIY